MTSRLTLSALLFSLATTAAMVWSAETSKPATAAVATRYVQLERVTITAPRLVATR